MMKRLGAALASALFMVGACSPASTLAPAPASVAPTGALAATPSPMATPRPTPKPGPTPTVVTRALVPVTNFRAPWISVSAEEVRATADGTSTRFEAIEVVESVPAILLAMLSGITNPQLVIAPDAASLREDLAAHPNRLGFLFADEIDPSVEALGWDDRAMFGEGRVKSLEDWPLMVVRTYLAGAVPETPAVQYDPARAWTLVAGGDIMLDRGVAKTVKTEGKGIDFPFDGGTVKITSRCKDCSVFGWDLPRTQRTGDAGVVRSLVQGADLAIFNFENPAPDAFTWHSKGTVFSADPALIEGLANAGVDWVSLANNHIRDAGAKGILQTMTSLDKWSIAHSGAGADITAARKPALLTAGGQTVAMLGYDTIAGSYWATPSRVGSAPMTVANLREDVAASRAAGADIVIVFPHWGTEYDATPFAGQRALGEAAIDAGADMVIGNHAHWAAAMEVYRGKPIWYALGNFVFDQTWSEPTMEGITLELTFDGARLVQIRMRPHLILDKSQPNFMDPAGSGAVVMDQVWKASKGLLGW
ncbi:MAG: CapA family protein [Chloroflexota bacterium]